MGDDQTDVHADDSFHCPCGDPLLPRLRELLAPLLQRARDGEMTHAEAVKAKELNLLKEGDLVVQSAGTHTGVSGSTDLVKVSIVGNEAEATLI